MQLSSRADDQRQFVLFGGDVGADHARQRAFIGERQRAVIQGLGLRDQFFRLRSAAQKREIAQGSAVRRTRQCLQANTPCTYQRLE